ncbi:MAG TPA: DEAD/DEAH box helicase [Gallicola sp.]|jgi:DEAD/DEAH box helicase domain-containing protein|nr:DEAD/DEAH box helicase [Gallicola sp.]
MKNPINVFDTIKESFILYMKTAFGTRYPKFEEERENLLNKDKIFARAPWVEPLPEYERVGFVFKDIEDVPNLNDEELEIFRKLAGSGLVGNYQLYKHQYEMLQKAMAGNHCVITSGTGSGKTESFLLPLFAYLSKELNKWRFSENKLNNNNWWSQKGRGAASFIGKGNTTLNKYAQQRPNPNRPSSVKAMLIYPMNALVEDQLSRLRKSLDSDVVRELLDREYNKNRIYFGRYNSNSPVSGKLWKLNDNNEIVPDSNKFNQLREKLSCIENKNIELQQYLDKNPDNLDDNQKTELVANFQRLDGAEMRTRFDMHITPPDIMITNFSMLSIMLMRDIENPIFDQTRDWLECKDLPTSERENEKKDRIFHIIIDELHLYRGGSGSETAYIIRMLLERLGLTPDSDQLRILASSASLEKEEGKNFLKSFFGVENKEIVIISGAELKQECVDSTPLYCLVSDFEKIGIYAAAIEASNQDVNSIEKLNDFLKSSLGIEDIVGYVLENQESIKNAMYFAFKFEKSTRAVPAFINGDDDNTPNSVRSIAEVLFGTNNKKNKNAVKGFFFLLGLMEKYNIKHSFPRFRFHLFYRNIPGLWGELISDEEIQERGVPIGEILNAPFITHNNHRTLELLYCENCGIIAYGGSRVEYYGDDSDLITELLPISPDIEGVPENSSATIVEKRKYKDFSIFCPGSYGNESERNTNIIEPEYSISRLNGEKLVWCNAWLNVNSGKIETQNPNDPKNYIKGRWLRVAKISTLNDEIVNVDYNIETINNLEALPHICPHCEADYSHHKKKRKSPFRGFRTGFGKVSQLMSKELFNLLPEGDNNKKLVAFSDSREDAAKLAKNIEEEHYSALLKEVLVHNLTSDLQFDNDVLKVIEKNDAKEKERLKAINLKRYNYLGQLSTNVMGEFSTEEQKKELNAIKANFKKTTDFVNIVIREMLKFGLNPGGPFISIQKFSNKPWYKFFNFETFNYNETIDGFNNVKYKIDRQIERNIAGLIFGRLFYSFEASGLGFATIQKDNFLTQKACELSIEIEILFEICNSYLRLLGDNYRHNRIEYELTQYESFEMIPSRRKEKRYIQAVSSLLGIDQNVLGNTVFAILQNNSHRGNIVEINNLFIKVVTRDSHYFKCSHCGTIHLHNSGGICVFCMKKLNNEPEIATVEKLWNENYLTVNLNKEYKPFRLHTEELTGQTDDQLTRQSQFKNIFLDTNDKLIQQIDLLSVTTTLEVGVDIGSLQAIFLANMPPQRFNYQQRVGRTGRRGQMYSYSLTFARGRSHDEFYFENPYSITGDKPPQPYLSLDQERIFKRVLAKAILRFAFKKLPIADRGNSVHGEFGDVQSYSKEKLQEVIEIDLSSQHCNIEKIFNSLNVGIYKGGELKKFDFKCLVQWIKSLPKVISELIDRHNATSGDLSELLAESGLLPMGGMPTRVKNLIHGFKETGREFIPLSIDRDISVAIYEFAPKAQKTKDKGVVQAIGFTPNIQGIYKTRDGYTLKKFNDDSFTERKWLIQNKVTKSIHSVPYRDISEKQMLIDNNPDCSIFIGAIPAAFRTDFETPRDSNEDFEFSFSKPLTFAESGTSPDKKNKGNYCIKYSQQEVTWKINNNGGDLFKGQYVSHQKYCATFNQQWILKEFLSDSHNLSGVEEEIALTSSKVTEVFRIEPEQLDFGLDINPFSKDVFKSASSKGAFYSAAFLLQRTLAHDLDVDPEEIEIAAIESYNLPEKEGVKNRSSASIVLTDELPNGSGFVQQLYEEFDKYLNLCINPEPEMPEHIYNYSIITNQESFDAGYADLKNYRNMNFHPLLDWRLAVGLLRVLSDPNYFSGLKESDYKHPELTNWLEFSKSLAYKMANNFENIKYMQFDKLHGFCIADTYNVIITHPFWNYSTHQPNEEVNILTSAMCTTGLENLYFIDTFNLHRRPGFCYGEIINRIINE